MRWVRRVCRVRRVCWYGSARHCLSERIWYNRVPFDIFNLRYFCDSVKSRHTHVFAIEWRSTGIRSRLVTLICDRLALDWQNRPHSISLFAHIRTKVNFPQDVSERGWCRTGEHPHPLTERRNGTKSQDVREKPLLQKSESLENQENSNGQTEAECTLPLTNE